MKFIETAYSLYHFFMAWGGNIVYGAPSKSIFVIGVTGTKGKSTVLELMNAILEAGGKKTALMSSVRFKIFNKTSNNETGNSMPGRFRLQRFLRDAVRAGCEYAFIEVTSQGVAQHRHRFIEWDAALCTNIAPEHIEAHGSFEKYRETKIDFFRYVARSTKTKKYFFINEEDAHHHYFEEEVRGISDSELIFFSRDRFVKEDVGRHYDVLSRAGRQMIGDWLLADFNLENAAAAAAFARSRDLRWACIKAAFDNFRGVPGRMEFIQKTPFAVVIDYAHTPESLRAVYETLDPSLSSPRHAGEMVCVLGCAGGGRDTWKRPVMGRIAAEYCDKIILTNEDPYDEDQNAIIEQIEEGFLQASNSKLKPYNYFKIFDRREAIQKAIALASKGDVVIITGKGSESSMHFAHGKKIPWNERRVVEEALKKVY